MRFLAGHFAVGAIVGLAVLATILLAVVEWRRPDRGRPPGRLGRLGATLLAVAALGLWALRPTWRAGGTETSARTLTAALWTGPARTLAVPAGVAEKDRFALPGAEVPGDAGVTFLPDVATMRRRYPEVGRLQILGGGLDPADLPVLAGMSVAFTPGPAVRGPAVAQLRCPRVLPLGDELTMEGRVAGLPAGASAALTLEGPDGTTTGADTAPADGNGEAGFAVRAPSPTAAGRFLWRLRLKGSAGETAGGVADETLGIEVRAPSPPRVLVLESAPRFDTALLRRWYEQAGGTFTSRLRLGQDRFRFFAAGATPPPEFNALDAPLLARFDLVLADGRALASLPAPEREILRAAVAGTGLGVLVLADDAVLPPAAVAPDRAWLFPWQFRPLEAAVDPAASGTEHLARVRWPGPAQPAEILLPSAPCEILPLPGQTGAVRDDQGRVLAALTPLGRGTLALTLVRETGRWQRAGEPDAFARYWSFLFGQTARRTEASGTWQLAGGDAGPVFVDRPLEFVWSGAADTAPPGPIRVADDSGAPVATLAPASDPGEPGRWRVEFWPRRAGWHRIEADGGGLDFYVHPDGAWPALDAARRRSATERFAARSATGPDVPAARRTREPEPIPAGWWFGAFLLGAGFLWTERRFSRA